MTKTKDPDFHKALTDVNQAMLKIVEPIKRCDECRWWICDWSTYCLHVELCRFGMNVFRPSADFYCKYWEKKERE